ncbi:MAG: hypothetical protein FH762_19700 [Firmicutes bacterium]|nr:hypothetical protein [Bacillota bacterium]
MALTDEEKREASKKFIEDYTGLSVDWDNPPGAATLALDRLMDYDTPAGVASEQIDDLSKTYINYAGLDPVIRDLLNSIRKLKW